MGKHSNLTTSSALSAKYASLPPVIRGLVWGVGFLGLRRLTRRRSHVTRYKPSFIRGPLGALAMGYLIDHGTAYLRHRNAASSGSGKGQRSAKNPQDSTISSLLQLVAEGIPYAKDYLQRRRVS